MEPKTCKEVGIKVCKAECCRWVPMKEQFLLDNQRYFQRPVYAFADYCEVNNLPNFAVGAGLIYPITAYETIEKDGKKYSYIDRDKQYCPFLNPETLRCSIYNQRPEICKAYGRCKIKMCSLSCGYQFGENYACPPDDSPEAKMMQTDFMQRFNIAYMYKYEPLLFKEMTQNIDKKLVMRIVDSFDMRFV